jgi:orotate phosphoribosyltransferase-like protein
MRPANDHKPRYIHASWLTHSVCQDKLRAILPKARAILRKYQFDSIAFRGISGALTAPILAYMLRKNVLVIRKSPEEEGYSHSGHEVEGDMHAQRYVIVDDFVSTGKTITEIFKKMCVFAPEARCLGILEIEAIADIQFHSWGLALSMKEIIRRRGRLSVITEKFVTRYLDSSYYDYMVPDAQK